MYIQVEAKAYTSGRYGIYKWYIWYIQVESKVYTSGS